MTKTKNNVRPVCVSLDPETEKLLERLAAEIPNEDRTCGIPPWGRGSRSEAVRRAIAHYAAAVL